jgi:hypothetical protein
MALSLKGAALDAAVKIARLSLFKTFSQCST